MSGAAWAAQKRPASGAGMFDGHAFGLVGGEQTLVVGGDERGGGIQVDQRNAARAQPTVISYRSR